MLEPYYDYDYDYVHFPREIKICSFAVYVSLYPDLQVTRIAIAQTIKKYASAMIWDHRFSSKLKSYPSTGLEPLKFAGTD